MKLCYQIIFAISPIFENTFDSTFDRFLIVFMQSNATGAIKDMVFSAINAEWCYQSMDMTYVLSNESYYAIN